VATRRIYRLARMLAAMGCAVGLAFGLTLAGVSPAGAREVAQATALSAAHPGTMTDCPNPEGGGPCIGRLQAGKTYTTQWFIPQITYRVDQAGWANYEDLPGNFLLVPPGNDLAGVNAGTSDFIGVYTAIQPTHLTDPASCTFEPVPGKWNSPRAVAGYFYHHPLLVTSRPVPVSVGGLNGFVVTSRIKPGSTLDRCTFDDGTFIELAGTFSGIPPSYLDHTLIPDMTMRLFLLSFNDHVLAIEVDDIDAAPATLAQLTTGARHLRFRLAGS
jgi:hypothetical protein